MKRVLKTAEIVTIGWELLRGQTLDRNSAYLGSQVYALGVEPKRRTTVGDDEDEIVTAIENAMARADLVLLTGGLGPTPDDRTKSAVCRALELELEYRPGIWRLIVAKYRRRGIEVADSVREQAHVPKGAHILPNRLGSAQGIAIEKRGRLLAVMPGVPREMRDMFERLLVPMIRKRSSPRSASGVLRTTGIVESRILERISGHMRKHPELDVAFLPSYTGVDIRLRVAGSDRSSARRKLGRNRRTIRESLLDKVFAEDERTLAEVIGEILRSRGETLSTAESCTAGMIAGRVTDVPGSSDYFLGGVVAYANEAKVDHLGVSLELIERHGAVSAEVAAAMSEGALARFGSTWAVSTTGIAGPGGGTEDKPVGLVYIGLSGPDGTHSHRFTFGTDREVNRQRTVGAVMTMLWRALSESS